MTVLGTDERREPAMSDISWREPYDHQRPWTLLSGTAPDGTSVYLEVNEDVWATYPANGDAEGNLVDLILVKSPAEAGIYSTESAADWPMVDQYIPRGEWPACISNGQTRPRSPDPAVATALRGVIEGILDRPPLSAETLAVAAADAAAFWGEDEAWPIAN